MSVMHVKCVTEKDHLTVSEMELASVAVLLLQPTQNKSKIEQLFDLLYGCIRPGGMCVWNSSYLTCGIFSISAYHSY